MKILLIEDEPEMRTGIKTVLELEDFAVVTAINGREGVKSARKEKPDLILCDVMMPELDGYGVLAMVRMDENLAGTPFIFLTAKGEKQDLRLGMNSGADDYLTKPVAIDDLLKAVRMRLERKAQHTKAAAANITLRPDFSSSTPLEKLGLTPKEAEVLLWVAQGKSNADTGSILEISEHTVRKHLEHIFAKLGIESRGAATLLAVEALAGCGRLL
jgi:DNA-binding NarL/FixJ family response regulator